LLRVKKQTQGDRAGKHSGLGSVYKKCLKDCQEIACHILDISTFGSEGKVRCPELDRVLIEMIAVRNKTKRS
jgi:hypothetical protein